jgi:hypothetical protein
MKELLEKYLKISYRWDYTEIDHFDGTRWISTTRIYSDPRGISLSNPVKFEKYITVTEEEYNSIDSAGSFPYQGYSVVYQKITPEYSTSEYNTNVRHTLYLGFYSL